MNNLFFKVFNERAPLENSPLGPIMHGELGANLKNFANKGIIANP
jgi:hypothetical protein